MKAKQTTIAANLSKAFKVASETLVSGIQAYITSKANIEASLVAMKRTKVKFGKSRATCAMLAYVYDQLGTIKTAKGTPLTASTKDGYLNAIKRSINLGVELNLNSRRKPKPAGQSQVPASKDKAKLTDDMAVVDVMAVSTPISDTSPAMATDQAKPASVKPSAFKSNEQAVEALQAAVKAVKVSCTAKQWQALVTLYPNLEKLAD